MSYKLVKGSKGNRWLKDGKFVSEKNVPEEEKNKWFESEKTQVKQNKELENLDKKCIVCGSPADHKRLVLGMMVGLCDGDYYTVSYGYIAGLMRKKGI